MNHSQIVSFLWGVADLIRDTFKRGKYQDVILPLTVLRRLDCVLAPTKAKVLEVEARYKGQLGESGRAAPPRLRFRVLQHVPVRLREAPRRCARYREEPARLHRRLQPQHARSTGEVRLRQHPLEARRSRAALPGPAAVRRPEGETSTRTRSTTSRWARSSRSSSASSTRL